MEESERRHEFRVTMEVLNYEYKQAPELHQQLMAELESFPGEVWSDPEKWVESTEGVVFIAKFVVQAESRNAARLKAADGLDDVNAQVYFLED